MKSAALVDGAAAHTGPWSQAAHVYPCGTELFREGDPMCEVYYVVSGMVKLTKTDANGRESLIGLAEYAEWVGTAAVLAGEPAPATAITCGRTTLSRYPAAMFGRMVHEHPQLSLDIHHAHARELCRQSRRISQLCVRTSRERLASALSHFAMTVSSGTGAAPIRLQLPLRQWELAEFIGVTPEHLSRLLKELERDGLIRRQKGWIVIDDVQYLDALGAAASAAS